MAGDSVAFSTPAGMTDRSPALPSFIRATSHFDRSSRFESMAPAGATPAASR